VVSHRASRLQARNDNWTFETVRADSTLEKDRFYYEAMVLTEGILQVASLCSANGKIGWASPSVTYHGDTGRGVGDDASSLAFDGSRYFLRFKLNGRCRITRNNVCTEFGQHWKKGVMS
jgi:hypothetical protein